MATYPTGIRVFIDDTDVTYYLFGVQLLDPDDDHNIWRDMDITGYLRKTPGYHTVRITSESGAGRIDVRAEIV